MPQIFGKQGKDLYKSKTKNKAVASINDSVLGLDCCQFSNLHLTDQDLPFCCVSYIFPVPRLCFNWCQVKKDKTSTGHTQTLGSYHWDTSFGLY